jgi:hypothetical protein
MGEVILYERERMNKELQPGEESEPGKLLPYGFIVW